MTENKTKIKLALAMTFLLAAGLFANPVRAQTDNELKAVQGKIARLEREATAATERYERLHEKLITTEAAIETTEAALGQARKRMSSLEELLGDRARAAYQAGGTSTVELLLEADSISEFSSRMVYLDRLVQQNTDLVTEVDVLSEELRRRQEDLAELRKQYAEAEREAEREKDTIYGKLREARALEEKIADKLAAERAAARAAVRAAAARAAAARAAPAPAKPSRGGGPASISTVSGGALQACPAPGTSFTDTFGAPRSGGRSHQGVDMMGPYGTPVYAAQSGRVTRSSSSLGGLQAYVYAGNGDFTFYAHLQGYSNASGNVSAGTLIGYIGDTGNAQGSPHLHFEYHPGGGAAANPTPHVAAVC